jgi:UDP-N-acetylglucosamine:LPS N-acetylglucosamine transferase
MGKESIKVLAVASAGGHWDQLMLLRPTLEQYDIRFATTEPTIATHDGIANAEILPDCNQNTPIACLRCALLALWVVLKHRPEVILSIGAAPGFFCILAGRLIGARTLWIESIADAEELSLSGKLSKHVAHQCWSQSEHVAAKTGTGYHGAVL